jgi:hypothetical protein
MIAGIDLGTTNSLIGAMDAGFPVLLADAEGRRLTPSAVAWSELGEVEVGRAVNEAHVRHGADEALRGVDHATLDEVGPELPRQFECFVDADRLGNFDGAVRLLGV